MTRCAIIGHMAGGAHRAVSVVGAADDVAAQVSVDRTSPVPIYHQVAVQLEALIVAERLPPGARLANEIELADCLGVSRPTMRAAIGYLVDRGLLVRKRGVGTQVMRAQVNRSLALTSLHDDLLQAGRRPTTELLELTDHRAEPDVAAALAVESGTTVTKVCRLRSADGQPIAVLTNHLPRDLVRLDPRGLERHGLYELLRAAGVRIRIADQAVGAASATARQASLLGERRGAALLTMTRTAYDDEGLPVEFGNHVYRASAYRFSMTLVDR
jgi:DNA-binding GntR family transcriptional regulator